MAKNEHAHESQWEQWVAAEACTCLAGQRCTFVSRREGRKALPDAFVAWLLDQDRWGREGFGDAWRDEGSPRAAEFIRRSVDSWPDEDMLCELKRLGELAETRKRLPADEVRTINLLAWWITLNRGLIPKDFTPENPRRRTYGDIVTTHIGRAVYSGLLKKNRHLVHESGEIAPAMAEAYRTIFDISLMQTLDYLCKTECKVVDICRKYKPDSGDAWGYLHRCIENYIHDFLESKDKEVSVPTMNTADRFRRLWKAAERQVNPSDAGPAGPEEFSQDEQMETLAWRSRRVCRDCEDDEPDDPETSGPQLGIPSDTSPVARAALLLKYTPPTDWSDVAVDELARDFGLEDERRSGFIELVAARSRRLELSLIRRDACFEKREYLRVLKERTREGLGTALGRDGHSKDQIKQRIDLLEKQASEGEVLLGEVRAVQKAQDCPVDSQAYLAARFQELTISERKMSRYAANYEAEWQNRYVMASDELKSLADVFSTPSEEVKRQLTRLEQTLGLL